MIHESLEDGALDPAIKAMWTAFTVVVAQIDLYSPTTVIVLLTVSPCISHHIIRHHITSLTIIHL